MQKPTIILGLGNPLMADEGIGTELIVRLQKHDIPPDVELLDAGTGGMALLHHIADREKAVLVDWALSETIDQYTQIILKEIKSWPPKDIKINFVPPSC